jgi:hypothetical protein
MSGFGYSYEGRQNNTKRVWFHGKIRGILSVTLERLVGEVQRTLAVFTQNTPTRQ